MGTNRRRRVCPVGALEPTEQGQAIQGGIHSDALGVVAPVAAGVHALALSFRTGHALGDRAARGRARTAGGVVRAVGAHEDAVVVRDDAGVVSRERSGVAVGFGLGVAAVSRASLRVARVHVGFGVAGIVPGLSPGSARASGTPGSARAPGARRAGGRRPCGTVSIGGEIEGQVGYGNAGDGQPRCVLLHVGLDEQFSISDPQNSVPAKQAGNGRQETGSSIGEPHDE